MEVDTKPSKDERMWGTILHLSSLVGWVVPFGHLLAPLIIWLVKREDSPFLNQHGKEAVNFAISLSLYGLISGLLVLIFIGFVMLGALGIYWVVVAIIAAVKANDGESYNYPWIIRFIK